MFPKFSCGAELQPLRASRPLSFPQTRRFGVRESKPKFLTPNSVSIMAEITPTSLVMEIPETSENPTYYANTNSRTVIQITKKCKTLTLQRVYSLTHTHTNTHWRSHSCGSLGKAEKGEVTCPRYDDMRGTIQNWRVYYITSFLAHIEVRKPHKVIFSCHGTFNN